LADYFKTKFYVRSLQNMVRHFELKMAIKIYPFSASLFSEETKAKCNTEAHQLFTTYLVFHWKHWHQVPQALDSLIEFTNVLFLKVGLSQTFYGVYKRAVFYKLVFHKHFIEFANMPFFKVGISQTFYRVYKRAVFYKLVFHKHFIEFANVPFLKSVFLKHFIEYTNVQFLKLVSHRHFRI
jgi:hypothetical protein